MTKLFNKALLIVLLAIVMCGFSIPASAITFTYTERAGFIVDSGLLSSDAGSPANDIKWYQDATAPVSPLSGEYNTIAWGVSNNAGGLIGSDPWGNANYSALKILGQTGTVDADAAGWVTLAQIYHQNSSIPSSIFTLKNAILNGNLSISPADPGVFPDDVQDFVTFKETLNAGVCDPAGPGGPACPDYFTVAADVFAPLTFTYGGVTYQVEFDLAPITTAQIDPINIDGDIRVWTQESATSEIDVLMRIVTVPVPEPATLTLLGLGLLGLGVIKRRRKND
jgi:hypothetical protein